MEQTSNNATPDDEGEISSSSSSSESESDLGESEDTNSGEDDTLAPPVKRKLPFNRETNQFSRVDISPGSLEEGRDARGLEKLQELLLANPGAVSAIDTMLKMLQTGKTPATEAGQPPNVPEGTEGTSQGTARPPQRGPVQGISETTVYTRAVPSASPSQQDNSGQDVQMNRLALSLNAVAMHATEGNPAPLLQNVPDSFNAVLGESDQSQNVLSTSVPNFPPDNIAEPVVQDGERTRDHDRLNEIHLERLAAKTRTDAMVVEAERQKLGLEKPLTGTVTSDILAEPGSSNIDCDDQLFALSVHLDLATIRRIEQGEYVELSKLLPRDKVVPGDEYDKVEIVSKDGKPAFAPHGGDRDAQIINSYKRWEAAFDIYAGIFVRAQPRRGPELYQYKHTIWKAADSYVWPGIYAYDKIFRTHMQSNPGRTWAKKHRNAWTDHVHVHKTLNYSGDPNGVRKRKICRFFNKNGRCSKGAQCEFEHRCSVCLMFGHGKFNCRKAKKEEKDPAPAAVNSNSSLNNSA